MRKYLDINLPDQLVQTRELVGEEVALTGRYHIVKTLFEGNVATVDPLSDDNPLIFSAGPFAGTNMSNANRLSVGCKSPLTGGIKESNAGGNFAVAMGHLALAGFTLHGVSQDWTVIRITKEGDIGFETAEPYLGKGNIEAAKLLFEKYGEKVSIGLCGPVGEYQGLLAGIAFTDPDGRPTRLAARGGVGAVMGAKKVKAIVIDLDKAQPMADRKAFMKGMREYTKILDTQPGVKNLKERGTAFMADITNLVGALPVNNFSSGQQVKPGDAPLKMGGEYIRDQNIGRGGDPSHPCMPGCQIKCSNVYMDKDGKEVVSPLEYETIGLMGTNCGLDEPDDVARLNHTANDLGVDSIELGAMIGVLMEAGVGSFGDLSFMKGVLDDIRTGNDRGRLFAQGTARVGEHYDVKNVPVIKKQALSAYDPRVIEVTGISMMTTAQGADHTAGNLAVYECAGKSTEELAEASFDAQVSFAASDNLGICIFGRVAADANPELIVDTINNIHGTQLDASFMKKIGRKTLEMEEAFNKAAGFTVADDELPDFFYEDRLAPTGKTARHRAGEINRYKNQWWQKNQT
ncbi:MAG: aldehyde ferredoxin oxidoreductase [Rhodobacteraceae bacterium]|nr:aldehyde ferredoxin oxidoreductase [Paracoccaceae bacterium]